MVMVRTNQAGHPVTPFLLAEVGRFAELRILTGVEQRLAAVALLVGSLESSRRMTR